VQPMMLSSITLRMCSIPRSARLGPVSEQGQAIQRPPRSLSEAYIPPVCCSSALQSVYECRKTRMEDLGCRDWCHIQECKLFWFTTVDCDIVYFQIPLVDYDKTHLIHVLRTRRFLTFVRTTTFSFSHKTEVV